MAINKKISVEPFFNQDGNYKRLASSFFYDKFSFDNYEHRDNGEYKTIFTTIDYGIDIRNFLTVTESRDSTLLVNMLSLINKLPQDFFKKESNILYLKDLLPEDTIKVIIKWCITNGFPFDIGNILDHQTSTFGNIIKPKKYISFRLCDFIYRLNDIGSAYHLYRIITDNGDNTNLPIFTSTSNEREYWNRSFIDIRDLTKSECRELFENKYQNIKYKNQISIGKEIRFDVKTNSLFDAAYYQLALLLYDTEKEFRICPLCHEHFEPHHAKQKYCNSGDCYPQKAYKRKKLAEKKKGSSTNEV